MFKLIPHDKILKFLDAEFSKIKDEYTKQKASKIRLGINERIFKLLDS